MAVGTRGRLSPHRLKANVNVTTKMQKKLSQGCFILVPNCIYFPIIKRIKTKDVIRFATIMKRTLSLLWLFLFLTTTSTSAQTFEPPVIIDPPNPQVGDIIRVGLFEMFFPPCLILPEQNFQGLSHLFEQSGNDIRLTAVNEFVPVICNPFPVTPAPREYYELGVLEEGIYSLETWVIDPFTPMPVPETDPPTFFPLVYGETITFRVTAQPKIINTFNNIGILILILTFMLISFIFHQKHPLYQIKS